MTGHPSVLKIRLITQEIAAAGKEYPAPWLKNGGKVTRGPDGRFGSPSGLSGKAADAIASAKDMTNKAIQDLRTHLGEIGDAIENLQPAEKIAIWKETHTAESSKKMQDLEAQAVEGAETAIRQARDHWDNKRIKEALTVIDSELQKLEPQKDVWAESGKKARQSAKALIGAGAIIAGIDTVIAGGIGGAAITGVGAVTTGVGAVIAGVGGIISLSSVLDYEDKDATAKKVGGVTTGVGGFLATKVGPALMKGGIGAASSLIGIGLAEMHFGHSMATSDEQKGFKDSLATARDKLKKAREKQRRKSKRATEESLREAQQAIEKALDSMASKRK